MVIVWNFERFQCFNFEKKFWKTKNVFKKLFLNNIYIAHFYIWKRGDWVCKIVILCCIPMLDLPSYLSQVYIASLLLNADFASSNMLLIWIFISHLHVICLLSPILHLCLSVLICSVISFFCFYLYPYATRMCLYFFSCLLYVRSYLVLWKYATFTEQYSNFHGIR